MAENKLKERWKAGKAAVNGWLAIPSAFSAEVMAQCGWDSVTVDMQHGVEAHDASTLTARAHLVVRELRQCRVVARPEALPAQLDLVPCDGRAAAHPSGEPCCRRRGPRPPSAFPAGS